MTRWMFTVAGLLSALAPAGCGNDNEAAYSERIRLLHRQAEAWEAVKDETSYKAALIQAADLADQADKAIAGIPESAVKELPAKLRTELVQAVQRSASAAAHAAQFTQAAVPRKSDPAALAKAQRTLTRLVEAFQRQAAVYDAVRDQSSLEAVPLKMLPLLQQQKALFAEAGLGEGKIVDWDMGELQRRFDPEIERARQRVDAARIRAVERVEAAKAKTNVPKAAPKVAPTVAPKAAPTAVPKAGSK